MFVAVDGLNMLHALRAQDSGTTNLDLMGICQVFAKNLNCADLRIAYFTALAGHLDPKPRTAQIRYLEALRITGVEVRLGEFRAQTEKCSTCGTKTFKYQEKQSDVGIAATIIHQAASNSVDEILLFSADTDFIPLVNMITAEYPHVSIRIVSTVNYLRPVYSTLIRASHGQIRLSPELVARFQLKLDQ
jgi:uncharacterized LabA/DUF88 family protein